jgi:ABC-type Fe3+/spermidine/putrescine transport system ATPase subunit
LAEVRIDHLSKQFGGVTALNDVSLHVATGEVVALLGPSGCGKTTLLRCLAGLEQPTSGTIEIGGEVLCSPGVFVPPARRNISMVFQSYALWPHMTVTENISYGLRVQKMPKPAIQDRVSEVTELLGLSKLKDRYPSQLSGGQQQRVAVARALALRADLVLFDEPLSNLDLRLRESVRADLRRILKKLGQTAVYVTHDIGEAVVVADRIVMMSAAAIVQVAPPAQIYHQPKNKYVAEFVGNTNTIPARVIRDGDGIQLQICHELRFSADMAVGAVPADADSVHVMIRPEYVEVSTGDKAEGVSAHISEVEFIGQVTALTIDVGGTILRAITLSRPDVTLVPGAPCKVRIADGNIVVMPDHTV